MERPPTRFVSLIFSSFSLQTTSYMTRDVSTGTAVRLSLKKKKRRSFQMTEMPDARESTMDVDTTLRRQVVAEGENDQ